jgi:hypothetical protein
MAATLSAIRGRNQLAEVRMLIADRSLGPSRVLLFRALTRLKAADRWQIIKHCLLDDELRNEARHLLHQRDLRAARRGTG